MATNRTKLSKGRRNTGGYSRRTARLNARNYDRYLRISRQQIFEDDFENGPQDNDTMEKEEILRTLINCGLSEYESRVYAALVLSGPAKAGSISKQSDVPQSKIYEVLDQLADKQLVEVFDGRPKEFKAAEPEMAIKNMLEEKVREIDSLKAKIEEMSTFLKPIKKEETLGGIWSIKGEKYKEFFNKASEMLRRADQYVYAITRDFSRTSLLSEEVKKSIRRGVKVRVIGMEKINERNYYKAKWYHDLGIDLRTFQTKVHPRIVVVDGRELLLRLDYNPQKRDRFKFNSLWSEDPSLVTVMDNYVKSIWKNASPIRFRRAKKV